MASPSIQIFVASMLVGGFAFVWAFAGRGRWHDRAARRLHYGVPWGTALTATIVLAFYLFVQGGLRHWEDPVVLPFVSWSYFYPLGILTSGIAHGSAAHIVSNLTATLALGPIAEYAWGHYPGGSRDEAAEAGAADDSASSGNGTDSDGRDAGADDDPDDWRDAEWADDELLPDGSGHRSGLFANPWVRALVVFPAGLFVAAFLTSAFSFAPSVGFSGAVFAIAGFAVVRYPIGTLLGAIGASVLGVLYNAIAQPVVRGGLETGAPSLPSWAGIAFQAHGLGFLLGVLAGLVLIAVRGERPDGDRLFFGVFGFGILLSLWLVVWPSGADSYTLYRGVGVVVVTSLAAIVTVAGSIDRTPLPGPLGAESIRSTGRTIALGWLALLAMVFGLGALAAILVAPVILAPTVALVLVLALPAIPAVLPERYDVSPVGVRHLATGAIVALAILLALPGPVYSMNTVSDPAAPGQAQLEVEGYSLGYGENETIGRELTWAPDVNTTNETTSSGLFVVNEEREIFTLGVREEVLAFSGEETVTIGGPTWHETIEVERVGWAVAGNDTVYAVDLHHDGETTRTFAANATAAATRLDGYGVTVVPTLEQFELRVTEGGEAVETVAVPAVGESVDVGDVTVATEERVGVRRVYLTTEESRALIATEETY